MAKEDRAPHLIVLENVCGTLTSHNGADFATICKTLADANYRFGALVIDAVHFVPQSRPRLFIVAVRDDKDIPTELFVETPGALWHPANLTSAYRRLSKRSKASWTWWHLPSPTRRNTIFADFIEENPTGVAWHTPAETRRLLDLMSPLNSCKVADAQKSGRRMVGAIYKRTRPDGNGGRVQRAEIRFDDVAGCLRTPVGGSSRQSIMVVDGNRVRSRLLSAREAARLMGLPEDYTLPTKYNEAYHLLGDGLVVPVVRFFGGAHSGAIDSPPRQANKSGGLVMDEALRRTLIDFTAKHKFKGKGMLSIALVLTEQAGKLGLPLDPKDLITEGGGQVKGAGGGATQTILARHGIQRRLSSEGGRTNRGALGKMPVYVDLLNDLHARNLIDLKAIEAFWIERVYDFFAGQPFKIKLDASKGPRTVVRDVIAQAEERQKEAPGMHYAGAVLQHLVGAKLDCALGKDNFEHNSFSTADAPSGRAGDFFLGDVAIHVTTSPSEAVIEKCGDNLNDGLRPILVTVAKGVNAAEVMADNKGIADRLDIFEIEQFIALNLYELALFAADGRRTAVKDLVHRYNEIVANFETDPSLRIDFRK